MPDDVAFSLSIKETGRLVAWPDKQIAINVGHMQEEFARNPDYYLRNYWYKLLNSIRMREEVSNITNLRFHDTRKYLSRLSK